MTAVHVGRPAAAPAARTPPAVPPSCRIAILVGESHQVDLVLPAAVPLSALVEPTRDAIDRVLRARGEDETAPGAYVFVRAAGMTTLAGDASLAAQGIGDGDLVALVPAEAAQRYGPKVENVSTALARYAQEHFPVVSARDAVAVGAALLAVALAVAAVVVWRLRWAGNGGWVAPVVFAGAAVAAIVAALVCARLRTRPALIDGTGWAGMVLAVLAGATGPRGGTPGSPHAFLACVVAIVGGLLLARFTGRHWSVAAAVVTAAAAGVVVAGVRMFFAVPGQRVAAVTLIAVLVVARAAPALGLWLARVPRQTFGSITGRDLFARAPGQPEDTVSPVASAAHDGTLSGAEVAEISRRSNRVLLGVLLGTGTVGLAASWLAVDPAAGRQWPFVAVVAVVALILVLRARAFRDRRHAIAVVAAASLSLIAVPAHYGLTLPTGSAPGGLAAAAGVLAVAVAALVVGAAVPSHVFSPPVRQAVEYLEYLLTALVVPFTAWAIGLLHFVRYH